MTDTYARQRTIIGTTADWTANDIVLGDGEIGVERAGADIKMKVGNGTDKWSVLPYVSGGAGGAGGLTPQITAELNKRLALTGGTMTGQITVPAQGATIPLNTLISRNYLETYLTGNFATPQEVAAGTVTDKPIAPNTILSAGVSAKTPNRLVKTDANGIVPPDVINAVIQSTGATDSGRIPELDANGKIDQSMLPPQVTGAFQPKGTYTPTALAEYPPSAGVQPGWLYISSIPYTFTGGDLNGESILKGDMIYWGADSKWHEAGAQIDTSLFFKSDGSDPMTGDLNLGNHDLTNIGNIPGYVKADGSVDITGPQVVGDATAAGEAINRKTGDARYVEQTDGVPVYDATVSYNKYAFVQESGTGDFYRSAINNNTGNALTDKTKWHKFVLTEIRDTVTLDIDPGGKTTPDDPLGGDPFDLLSSAITWINNHVSFNILTLNFTPGIYNESATVLLGDGDYIFKCNGGTVELKFTTTIGINGWEKSAIKINTGDTLKVEAQQNCVLTKNLTIAGTLGIKSTTPSTAQSTLAVSNDLTVENGGVLNIDTENKYGFSCSGNLNLKTNSTTTITNAYKTGYAASVTVRDLLLDGTISTPTAGPTDNSRLIRVSTTPTRLIRQPSLSLLNNAEISTETFNLSANASWIKDTGTGKLEQWGTLTGQSVRDATLTFPTAFKNGNYKVIPVLTDTTQWDGMLQPHTKTTQTCKVSYRSPSGGVSNWGFDYYAIGEAP